MYNPRKQDALSLLRPTLWRASNEVGAHEVRQRSAELSEANEHLEKELPLRRQAEQNFEAVVEFAPDAMVLSDKEGKIALVNAQTERLFGYRRSELIGKPADSLLPKRFRHQKILHRESDSAVARAEPRQELFGLHKDGSEFPVEVSLSPLGGDRAVSCAIIRDVSERHAWAQEVRQTAMLEERNRMACDVHDTLAQGLTGIILQLQSAQAAAAAKKGESLRKHAKRAHDLAKESLEQARRSVMALASQDAGDTLEDMLHRLAETMRSSAGPVIEFRVLGSPRPLPQRIKEGVLRIAQQSLTNALQHAHAGAIAIELDFSLDAVTLCVSDDGRGFSLAKRSNDQIGLKSMRQRASALGAELRIESRRGKGTRVAVEVPLPATP